ncbi:MAG: hypothetical protein Q9163_004341 [Psora crenata]
MATSHPFGLILPSRPVLTEPLAVSPTQYAFTFPAFPSFSHIVVFLLPGVILPEDTLAGVYIQLPGSAPAFQFLGVIGTNKSSAIFRVKSGTLSSAVPAEEGVPEDTMTDVDGTSPLAGGVAGGDPGPAVTVGISIEQAAILTQQLETLKASSSTALVPTRGGQPRSSPLSTKILAQRIIKNAFNFLASFAGSTGDQEVVPLKSFQDWWTKFERRIESDPGFLEREDS